MSIDQIRKRNGQMVDFDPSRIETAIGKATESVGNEASKEDIQKHKQGLINLLTHYITTGQYFIEPNLMNYDDYWHLARRS